jgi:hypothetical protein
MTLSLLRRLVAVLCVLSIAGMIVSNINNNDGAAMVFGFIGAMAIVCLMLGNALRFGDNQGGAQEALAAELEARVQELIASGADEAKVRGVVRRAVRLGRGEPSSG